MPQINENNPPVMCHDGIERPESDCHYTERYGWVTQYEYENEGGYCNDCDEFMLEHDLSEDGLCPSCEDEHSRGFSTRDCNTNSKKQRSEEQGKIIKTLRPYGVELECISPNSEHLRKLQQDISSDYGMKGDGSLRADNSTQQCIEVVTPILQGVVGEQSLFDLVKKMNNLKYTVNNTCGMHLHLDSQDFHDRTANQSYPFQIMLRSDLEAKIAENPDYIKGKNLKGFTLKAMSAIMSNQQGHNETDLRCIERYVEEFSAERVRNGHSARYLETILTNHIVNQEATIANSAYVLTRSDDKVGGVAVKTYNVLSEEEMREYFSNAKKLTHQYAKAEITRSSYEQLFKQMTRPLHRKNASDMFIFETDKVEDDKPSRIRQLLMFYLVFTPVILAMLPSSRRSNRYCQDVGDKLTVDKIEKIQSLDDVLKAWYKSDNVQYIRGQIRGHYDDSRYFGINLHSMFRNGTVEIRYHSGTINLDKIVNWIIIHSTILDKASNLEFDFDQLKKAGTSTSFKEKLDQFCSILNLSKDTIEYIEERIQHFNKCGIDKVKLGSLKGTPTDDEETMIPKKKGDY